MSKRVTALWLVVFVFAVRLLALFVLGPVETPDSSLYIKQADCILKTLNGDVAPCAAASFKSVGYGFVISSFIKTFGGGWKWGLTLFQTALSLLSSLVLARACFALTHSLSLAALCFAMHSLSMPLMIDPWILRDSIFASLLTIFIGYLVWQACERRPPAWPATFYLGLIVGLAASLREQLVYYAIFFLPLMLVWMRAGPTSIKHAIIILIIILGGPIVLTRIGLVSWNEAMSGQAVVSTNARTVMLQAVLPVARRYHDVFDGDSELDQAARATFRTYEYSEVVKINQLLLSRGLSPDAIGRLATAKFFETWRRYPLAIARTVATRFVEAGVTGVFNPGKAILLQKGYAGHDRVYFSARRSFQRAAAEGDIGDGILALLWFAGDAISFLLYLSAWAIGLAGTYRLLSGQVRRSDDVIVALFVAFLGVLLAQAMIHVEPRQIAGVMGIPLLLAICFWHRLTERFIERRPLRTPSHSG